MTLADPNPPSGWPFRGLLTSAQMNLIRAGIVAAVDGVNGGVYTLLSKLTFNGTAMFELGDKLQYTSRSITRAIPLAPIDHESEWSYGTNGEWRIVGGPSAAQFIIFPMNLPHGAVLDTVTVHYQGGAAARGGLAPAVMPLLDVYYKPINSTSTTLLAASTSDVFGSEAAYEAAHTFAATGIAHTIDSSANQYYAWVKSESGANAYTGGRLLGITATCTITSQSEWTP